MDFFKHQEKLELSTNVEEEKINAAINAVKKLLNETKCVKLFKEQEFMMYVPQEKINAGGSSDKILIQGVIDLLSLGEKNIIIDYKLSSVKSAEKLISLYKTQLKLYKLAAEKAFNIKIDDVYL